MKGTVAAVASSQTHSFSKTLQNSIRLIEGIGVEGDAHSGSTVKHRSRVAIDPTQPNLRQVHLIHEELFEELRARGFEITPGQIGENITTRGIDLLNLPTHSLLRIGETALVRITGLRNPCTQLDKHKKGLLSALLSRDPNGKLVRKAGVMGIVLAGGTIKIDDEIRVELPEKPYQTLQKV